MGHPVVQEEIDLIGKKSIEQDKGSAGHPKLQFEPSRASPSRASDSANPGGTPHSSISDRMESRKIHKEKEPTCKKQVQMDDLASVSQEDITSNCGPAGMGLVSHMAFQGFC